jgi:2-keto-3-deoxy-6-phosphogluconate aldolase
VIETGVIAIMRGSSGTHLYDASARLIEMGVGCLEITTNTPGAHVRSPGPMRALVAIEHSLIVAIWHILTHTQPYHPAIAA